MLDFFQKNPEIGIEINSFGVKAVVVSGRGKDRKIESSGSSELQAGALSESFTAPNIVDRDAVVKTIKTCLNGFPLNRPNRAALSLPDGVFRVQTLDFDQLPPKAADRDRLVRWRLEKTAAFDLTDTVLRYQTLHRKDKGITILACIAKKAVMDQYERLLTELGMEAWHIGLSSFSTFNLYTAYLSKKTGASALAHVTGDSFATIVSDKGGARFYRFKEIKRGGAQEIHSRLAREITDSLHFFTHMDPSQEARVGHVSVTGEPAVRDALAGELKEALSLDVDVPLPSAVLPGAAGAGAELAAALGAVMAI